MVAFHLSSFGLQSAVQNCFMQRKPSAALELNVAHHIARSVTEGEETFHRVYSLDLAYAE